MGQIRKQSKIAVLTSGGDAPGMNACVRSLVRSATFEKMEVYGVRQGFRGLIDNDLRPLSLRSVGNIIQRGGTLLGSARCPEFLKASPRARAIQNLKSRGITHLIVLGGDGSLRGAEILSRESQIAVIGVPCTIDNDLPGTDFSIGFNTAMQTAVECIDKIRDTADSHGRIFVVEVMGKDTGHLAIEVALAVGAEFVVIPEVRFSPAELSKKIKEGIARGKTGSIVVVAEKKKPGIAFQIAEKLQKSVKREVKTLILGHLQRGGAPSGFDRNLASAFGDLAVQLCRRGESRKMTAFVRHELQSVDFKTLRSRSKKIHREKLALIDRLSI